VPELALEPQAVTSAAHAAAPRIALMRTARVLRSVR